MIDPLCPDVITVETGVEAEVMANDTIGPEPVTALIGGGGANGICSTEFRSEEVASGPG